MNLTNARRISQVAVAACALSVLGAGIASACHPQGTIQKDVQDVTTGSSFVKADTASSALIVHPGDTLVYRITVRDLATADRDEMLQTIVTDELPAGLKLIAEDNLKIGTVAQNTATTRTIRTQVTVTKAGLIENQACFTGDSEDHKQPQKGCDVAYVKVVVPAPKPTPTPTPTPTPAPTPVATPTPTPQPQGKVLSTEIVPTTLPDTGASFAGTSIGLGAMASAGVTYIRSRKRK